MSSKNYPIWIFVAFVAIIEFVSEKPLESVFVFGFSFVVVVVNVFCLVTFVIVSITKFLILIGSAHNFL